MNLLLIGTILVGLGILALLGYWIKRNHDNGESTTLPIIFFVIALILGCVLISGIVWVKNNPVTPGTVQEETPASQDLGPSIVYVTVIATFPPFEATATPIVASPTAAPALIPEVVIPTETPFTGLTINDCPSASLGYHPDSGKPLEFKMYPYVNADGTGDTNVLCVYEVLDLTQEVKIHFTGTNTAIMADWSHGTYNDDGTLKDACPTGWECEGVSVLTDDAIIPVGTLAKLYVYIREQPAMVRFTEMISWTVPTPGSMLPFACEYIATQGHNMWNIRVPAWAQDQGNVGTIYGFGLPVGDTNRLTCPGFPIDWEPLPGQLTTLK